MKYGPSFWKRQFRMAKRKPALTWLRGQLKNEQVTIISNDCFGGEYYRLLQLPYNTPFVGLMLMAPCYIKLLQQFDVYMAQPLRFVNESKYPSLNVQRQSNPYPIGMLNDIEIHFLHYNTAEEAAAKWKRRCQRINRQNMLIKFAGEKDFATDEHYAAFSKLSFSKKISLGTMPRPATESCYHLIPGLTFDGAAAFHVSLRHLYLPALIRTGKGYPENFWQKWLTRWISWSLS